MDWANEEYVRVYTRETTDDVELSWQALALWRTLLLRFDRSGLLPLRNGWSSVAKIIRWPPDVVDSAGPELLRDGRVRMTEAGLFAPNFVAAQTASKSDKQRQRDSRDRRRAHLASMQSSDGALVQQQLGLVPVSHGQSHPVTPDQARSESVTLGSALLCSAEAMLFPQKPPCPEPEPDLEPDTPRKRNRLLPDDWVPAASEANRRTEQDRGEAGVDVSQELQKLKDWARGGAHKRADWEAVWRNWLRNAKPTRRPSRPADPKVGRIEPSHHTAYANGDVQL